MFSFFNKPFFQPSSRPVFNDGSNYTGDFKDAIKQIHDKIFNYSETSNETKNPQEEDKEIVISYKAITEESDETDIDLIKNRLLKKYPDIQVFINMAITSEDLLILESEYPGY